MRRPLLLAGLLVVVASVAAAALILPGAPPRRLLGWDVHRTVAENPPPPPPAPGRGGLASPANVAFEAPSRLVRAVGGLAVLAEDEQVRGLDPRDGTTVWSWRQERAEAVALEADGDHVLAAFRGAGMDAGRVRVRRLDARTGELLETWTAPDDQPPVEQPALPRAPSPDLVTVASDGDLLIADQADRLGPLVALDARTGQERWSLPDDERGTTYGVALAADVVYVLSTLGGVSDLRALDAGTGEQLSEVELTGAPGLGPGPLLHADPHGLVLANVQGSWLAVTWDPALSML